MAKVLSKYAVQLELLTAKYEKALKNVERRLDKFDKRNKRSAERIKTAFNAVLAGISIGAISRVGRSIVDAGLKMDRFERSLKIATGSAVGAVKEFDFVRQTANELGLSLESTAESYSKLAAASRGTALEGQATRDIFVAISEASRVLGLTAEQTGGALTAIEQIISKGKVSAEELRGQLGERLPGAFFRAAKAIGVTTAELDRMLKAGELMGEDLLPKLAAELHSVYGPEVEAAANDAQASFERFKTAIFELAAAIAQSGILDKLADLADLGSRVAITFGSVFLNADPFPFQKEINDAEDDLKRLEAQLQSITAGGAQFAPVGEVQRLNELIAEQERLIDSLIRKQKEALELEIFTRQDPGAAIDKIHASVSELDAVFKEQEESFEKFIKNFETAEEKAAKLRAELNKYGDELSIDQIERVNKEIKEILTGGLETIEVSAQKIDPFLRDIERYGELIERNRTPLEEFERAIQEVLILRERLIQAGREEAEVNSQIARELERLSGVYSDQVETMSEMERTAREVGLTFTSAFEDAVVEGEKLRDVLQGLLKDLIRLFIRKSITEPFLDFFGGFFKPEGKAHGGPVAAGTPYVVGEEGPEIFVPKSAGNIIPNGMGGAVIEQHFHVQAGLPPQWQQQLKTVTQIAASAAAQATEKRLGGRR